MAKIDDATTKDLNESRAEALQALLESLSPGRPDEPNGGNLTSDQVRRLSDKIGQILGDAQEDGTRRNEKGELVNEEGLPIIDINEPITAADFAFRPDPASVFDDPDLLPLWTLSDEEKARRKAERERILDLLEDEEGAQETRHAEASRKRMEEEMEKRREAAKEEMDKLKKAREMQKKLGKALIRSVVESRDQAEKENAEQAERDRVADARKPLKPKKSVSFAETSPVEIAPPVPSVDKGKGVDWGDVVPGTIRKDATTGRSDRPTMKMHVVERRSSGLRSPAPPVRDSDDESEPEVYEDSDEGDHHDLDSEEDYGRNVHSPLDSADSEDDHHPDEEPSEWNDDDFDTAAHQREVALEYYAKRKTIGADVASAMRAHTHGSGEDEWDQAEVPLDATLASAPPKPSASRFKSERHAHPPPNPSSLASHSLGAAVLPSSQSASLKGAVRMGKLQNGQLVGGEEGESEDEVTAEDEDVRQFLDMLRRGEVKNVGPPLSTSAPQSAGPSSTSTTSLPAKAGTETAATEQPSDAAQTRKPSKVSKFKLALAQPGPRSGQTSPALSSALSTPTDAVERSSPKMHPTGDSTPEAASSAHPLPRLAPTRSISGGSLPPSANPAARQMPSMIVDSPSFRPTPLKQAARTGSSAAPPQGAPFQSVIMESPSFGAPGVSPSSASPSSTVVGTPVSGVPASPAPRAAPPMRAGVVERKPPAAVSATVREAIPSEGAERKQKVSRFRAERS
ncbi:hypothetical protein PsYK624_068460 [Phanerochaete sordida]|uniref:DUF3835 domain-containing protein n=1 Tax=Phanerochaete sordida TaxID=48140 RepID=A0A9P3LE81_9APHY|nr:hypothetical protein PsYK624_068460 [Phanerochaete sordida]